MRLTSTIYSGILFSMMCVMQTNAQDFYVVDRTFGETCGISTVAAAGYGYNPNEVFKLSTGEYLVVGDETPSGLNAVWISFARFESDGTVDTTFGTNGLADHTFSQRNTVYSILRDGDNIYVAGYQAPGNGFSSFRAYVARFNPDGTPDTSFNSTGVVVESVSVDPVSCSFYTHLALQPDGKIIAFGFESSNINGGSNAVIARRYNTDGSDDNTFHPAVRYISLPLPSNLYHSRGIVDQDSTIRFVYISAGNLNSVKLDPAGELVGGYGTGGLNTTAITATGPVVRYFADAGGNLYVQSQITVATQDIRVSRLNSNGDPDSTFSGDGIFDMMDYPGTNLSESGYVLHMDSQNRLWSMGAGSFAFTEPKGIIYRYDTVPAYDSTLSGTGYMAITEFSYTTFRNSYFETDDEIVISTITNGELGLLKLKLSYFAVQIQNTGSDTICEGSQAVLTVVNPDSCYTYQWKKDSVDIGNFNDTTLTVDSAGVYWVVATAGTDVVTSATISITVMNLPVASISFSGDTLFSQTTADVYQWFWNGNPIGGPTDSSFVGVLSGTYTLQITVNGCTDMSVPLIFSGIGKNPTAVHAFSVYADIANSEIIILNAYVSKKYFIEDLTGRLIMSVDNAQLSSRISFSSADLAIGNYLIRGDSRAKAVKFTIMR